MLHLIPQIGDCIEGFILRPDGLCKQHLELHLAVQQHNHLYAANYNAMIGKANHELLADALQVKICHHCEQN